MKLAALLLVACAHAPYISPPGNFSAEIERLLEPVAMYADACPPWFAAWTACVLAGGAHVAR